MIAFLAAIFKGPNGCWDLGRLLLPRATMPDVAYKAPRNAILFSKSFAASIRSRCRANFVYRFSCQLGVGLIFTTADFLRVLVGPMARPARRAAVKIPVLAILARGCPIEVVRRIVRRATVPMRANRPPHRLRTIECLADKTMDFLRLLKPAMAESDHEIAAAITVWRQNMPNRTAAVPSNIAADPPTVRDGIVGETTDLRPTFHERTMELTAYTFKREVLC